MLFSGTFRFNLSAGQGKGKQEKRACSTKWLPAYTRHKRITLPKERKEKLRGGVTNFLV